MWKAERVLCGPADGLWVLYGSRCGRRWWGTVLQKRCDDELNDLVPLRWRVWVCCVKRSAADPE